MNDSKTTFLNKDNKNRSKIVFKEFPNHKNKEKQPQKTLNNYKINSKILFAFLMIVILILFIASSFLNKKLLDTYGDFNIKEIINRLWKKICLMHKLY